METLVLTTPEMAHYMSRTPSPVLQLEDTAADEEANQAASILSEFLVVAERQKGSPATEASYIPLPYESDRSSEVEMEGAETPLQDEQGSESSSGMGKGPPSPGAVVASEGRGRRLVLASTSPTYTPPPLGGLHQGLRMVVADLTQTFSPPPDPACGDQWRGPDYVPSPVAELERLEVRRAELQAELRDRRAGYSINWSHGPPSQGTGSQGPSPPTVVAEQPAPTAAGTRRPRPSAFSPPRQRGGVPPDGPPPYAVADPAVAGTPVRVGGVDPLGLVTPRRALGTRPATPGPRSSEVRQTNPAPAAAGRAEPTGSYLEQFIPTEKVPLDAEGPKLASNTAKLINTLWALPMTRVETTELYATLPRPENADGLHKTRLNPEIESTLPTRTKDNDTALSSAQWGVQFAARPLARALDAIETGQPLETKELVAALVTTLKILSRTSNSLLTMRRDNVRPILQNQLKPLAKKDGGQGFKYLLGEDLTTQVSTLEASRKTANTIMRTQSVRIPVQKNYGRPGNYRGGMGRSRQQQSAPRHRHEEVRTHHHRPSGGNQPRPQRAGYQGGRGRAPSHFRGRAGRN